jgi:hypothetical protein
MPDASRRIVTAMLRATNVDLKSATVSSRRGVTDVPAPRFEFG